ncbi:hypothetical protein WJ67_18285 [Burkholderia ubonensis]|nr:hypothetical protein WJ67_18285 [Burkholderia ubonensis]
MSGALASSVVAATTETLTSGMRPEGREIRQDAANANANARLSLPARVVFAGMYVANFLRGVPNALLALHLDESRVSGIKGS